MRKLKLESLTVESFETTAAAPQGRGTVEGAADKPPRPQTYNPDRCGDTFYFDCTLGCTVETNCYCGPTDAGCV